MRVVPGPKRCEFTAHCEFDPVAQSGNIGCAYYESTTRTHESSRDPQDCPWSLEMLDRLDQ
jgi:hypothetical protein